MSRETTITIVQAASIATSRLFLLFSDSIATTNNGRSKMKSTVAILVPEAEGLVRLFRNRYDPSAKAGMPAHITLLYPFKVS
jgi:hypothetical protein